MLNYCNRCFITLLCFLLMACPPKIQQKADNPAAEKIVTQFMQAFNAGELEQVISLVAFPFWGGPNLFHSADTLKPILSHGKGAPKNSFTIESLTLYYPGGVDGVPERVNQKALNEFQGRQVLIAEMKYREAKQTITGYIFVHHTAENNWKVVGLMD